jgi:hypothetical protein
LAIANRGRNIFYFDFGPLPIDPSSGNIKTGVMYSRINATTGDQIGFSVIDGAGNTRSNYTGFYQYVGNMFYSLLNSSSFESFFS